MYWKSLLSAYSRAYPYLNFYLLIMSSEALKHKYYKGCCCLFYNFQLYVHWCTIQALLLSAVYACYYTNDYGKHFFIIPFLLPYFWNCFFTSAAKSLDHYSHLKPIKEKSACIQGLFLIWNCSISSLDLIKHICRIKCHQILQNIISIN